ncbi:MAG: hypothetical protein QOE59_960 [Actinomycetota bacterium]|nr:hypothetical protein [Actinomycetota bacterium]
MRARVATLLLAPRFGEAIGVDADPDMLAEARTQKTTNVIWRHLRAEELPADLVFRAAGFDGRER